MSVKHQVVIGISLGTTNVCMATIINGTPSVISNQEGERTTLAVVAYKNNLVLVGNSAKKQAVTNPSGTFYGMNRLIGKMFYQVLRKETFPFLIVSDSSRNGAAAVEFNRKNYFPEEIIADILKYLKDSAEIYLGKAVKDIVISIPAYFDDTQRQATKNACNIAGLEVLRIINDPTAAALAYGLSTKNNGRIAVYDFGGGTFDISILDINDGVFEVLATNGDSNLGGEMIDEAIVDYLIKEIQKSTGEDIKALDKSAWLSALQRIRIEAENAKKGLSSMFEYEINLPYLAMKRGGEPINFSYTLKRSKLEELANMLIYKTIEPCKKAMSDACVKPSDIDEVILVGEMARMPLVQETVRKIFGKSPSCSANPEEVVALGAAIQAGILS